MAQSSIKLAHTMILWYRGGHASQGFHGASEARQHPTCPRERTEPVSAASDGSSRHDPAGRGHLAGCGRRRRPAMASRPTASSRRSPPRTVGGRAWGRMSCHGSPPRPARRVCGRRRRRGVLAGAPSPRTARASPGACRARSARGRRGRPGTGPRSPGGPRRVTVGGCHGRRMSWLAAVACHGPWPPILVVAAVAC